MSITRSTAKPTFRAYQIAAYRRFTAMGFSPRSALFNATYYATHRVLRQPR